MIKLKGKEDIEILREGGRRLAGILKQVAAAVRPGITTRELDDLATELVCAGGDEAAFLNYRPDGSRLAYPASLCVSVNEEIVHGIPSARELQEGDIATVDLGLKHGGRFTDMAITVPVGKVSPDVKELIKVTREALDAGIKAAKPGNYTGDIGAAVAQVIRTNGYGLIRDLAGHGVGFAVHEAPYVPNYGTPGQGDKLEPGLVIAIEPMVALGSGATKLLRDGFTFVTRDGKISAHFEHTVLIGESGPEVLTR